MNNAPNFSALLSEAVNKPGELMAAYSAFYDYSLGNQMLAWSQCKARGIPIGPVATYKAWAEKGRQVKKGEKAIAMLVPVSIQKDKENKEAGCFTYFKSVNRWFTEAQTEGDSVSAAPVIAWDKAKALNALEITEVPFEMLNGNVQGYASGKSIAINPMAQLPLKTTFHELAHIVLGHTELNKHDETLPKSLKEVEAESVALLCLESLGLPGAQFCRGYIQNWIDTDGIPEKSAQKIIKAADTILKAGR
jgi:antirestriction protein ArdC